MAYHDCEGCGGACYCGGDIDDCPTGSDCVRGCGGCEYGDEPPDYDYDDLDLALDGAEIKGDRE